MNSCLVCLFCRLVDPSTSTHLNHYDAHRQFVTVSSTAPLTKCDYTADVWSLDFCHSCAKRTLDQTSWSRWWKVAHIRDQAAQWFLCLPRAVTRRSRLLHPMLRDDGTKGNKEEFNEVKVDVQESVEVEDWR